MFTSMKNYTAEGKQSQNQVVDFQPMIVGSIVLCEKGSIV